MQSLLVIGRIHTFKIYMFIDYPKHGNGLCLLKVLQQEVVGILNTEKHQEFPSPRL